MKKDITQAILRYQTISKKDGQSYHKNHRVMCDTEKAKRIMSYINVNGVKSGEIYITAKGTIFLKVNDDIFLPSHFDNGVVRPLEDNLLDFAAGQENIKDYIAKRNPKTYLKFFNDVEEMEE